MNIPTLNLRSLILVQILVVGLLTLGVWLQWGVSHGASFGIGAFLMLFNVLSLAWMWDRLLAKKSFALTSVIIVIKYTVLLGAILYLSHEAWFHVLGAGLGMAAFIMSTLIQVATMK